MQTDQLSIFDMPENPNPAPINVITSKLLASSIVRDIRTDGQRNRTIAFDVGEKVGGARKDLAQQRAAFIEKPSVELLEVLEKSDVTTAAEVIIRENFFAWFNFENCRQRGVEPHIAKAIQLLINRVPKESKDSAPDRKKYVTMLTFLSNILKSIKTEDEYYLFESRVIAIINAPKREDNISACENTLKANIEALFNEDDESSREYLNKLIQRDMANLFMSDLGKTMALHEYPGPFRNYFYKRSSRITALKNAFAIRSWDELLPPASDKVVAKNAVKRKPAWVRELPDNPTRSGGQAIHIDNPKFFIEHFGFRASEFGHYVDDSKAREHLVRSSEAFTDLADILQIPTKVLSLNGELAMAFGARGRGRALAHYEPSRKVINLTKENGSLGVLSHEWFHALDHFLYNASHSFENGKVGFLTDQDYDEMSAEVEDAVHELMETIKNGRSTAYIDVSKSTTTYTLRKVFHDFYDEVDGDVSRFMELTLVRFDDNLARNLAGYVNGYGDKQKRKYARQRVLMIRQRAEAFAQYHFERTGEKIEKVPYPVDCSEYYQHSINLDKGKTGKYWSSNIELTARAFECYVYEKLQEKGWTSDYLVCGIRDSVFPQGIDRERIFARIEDFITAIRPYLLELAN